MLQLYNVLSVDLFLHLATQDHLIIILLEVTYMDSAAKKKKNSKTWYEENKPLQLLDMSQNFLSFFNFLIYKPEDSRQAISQTDIFSPSKDTRK